MLGIFNKKNAISLLSAAPIAVALTSCSSGEPPRERVADPIILVFSPPADDGTPSRPEALRPRTGKTGPAAAPKKVPVLYIKAGETQPEVVPDKGKSKSASDREKVEASGRSKDSLRTFNDK